MILTDGLFLDYRRCTRRAFLNLHTSQTQPERPFLLKLRQDSAAHTAYVLKHFYPDAIQPTTSRSDPHTKASETIALMSQGIDYIYNGMLLLDKSPLGVTLQGTPHLLVKTTGKSFFGDWFYFPTTIQLGRHPKPEYKLIATYYAYLLLQVQGVTHHHAQIILRSYNAYNVNLVNWMPRLEKALHECTTLLLSQQEPEVFISRQRCSLCNWYSDCYSVAQIKEHLSLVPGITPSRYKFLKSLGISTLASLANAQDTLLEPSLGPQVTLSLKLQVQSLLEKRPLLKSDYLHPQLLISSTWEFYFDIEAEPELDVEYLLGLLLINTQTLERKYYPFFAATLEEEALIWAQFLELVNQIPNAPIFHYSEYEVETLKRLTHRYNTSTLVLESMLNRCVDLHYQVTTSLIMPVQSYSLKSLANWLGFFWRDPGISGDQCVCWYDDWLKTHQSAIMESILRYNEDDCQATYILKLWLVEFLTK